MLYLPILRKGSEQHNNLPILTSNQKLIKSVEEEPEKLSKAGTT